MPRTILAFGEVLWDLLPDGAILGGAPFNFAYRVNSLGEEAVMASRLGRDELGRSAMAKMRELGIDTTHIQWDDEHPTGTVKVSFDEDKNPDYVIIPGVAYDFMEPTEELRSVTEQCHCLCFGTLVQRSEPTRRTINELLDSAGEAVKLLDINLRKKCYSLETVTDSLGKCDILKLNEDEANGLDQMLELGGNGIIEIARKLIDRCGLTCCLVTLAERGALAVSGDKTVYSPGYEVELVDSLGSGDAFTAGFIHKHLAGESLLECCEYGNILGAIVTSQEGATAHLDENDISQFVAAPPERVHEPAMKRFAVQ